MYHWDPWAPAPPEDDTYTTKSQVRTRRHSSLVAGATLHHAIHPTSATTLENNLVSFLSYAKTQNIPILPVTKPDIRSVLGQGSSFLVNGAELPWTYTDPISGTVFPQGLVVAFKRAIMDRQEARNREELTAGRIHILFNELLTMNHPPLRSHPNIVKLLGIGLETEGESDELSAIPVLIPECAELGNLAEVLETARKEDRPLSFEEKISLCLDVAHGIEILHACDIVHGDVKYENILIFEREDDPDLSDDEDFRLYCKLTDFGVTRIAEKEVRLFGSYPWQAPEVTCSHAALFEIEDAKRTDIYSFGMLLWRVMLDGDPFKTLGEFQGSTGSAKRKARNEAIAALKDKDHLVQHVCESLALSEKFSQSQLHMLSEVMHTTLRKESSKRELYIERVIRLLTPNQFFEARHPVAPARMPLEVDAQVHLLDLEKWHSEFEGASPIVQEKMLAGFKDYSKESNTAIAKPAEKQSAAAYQVAICYANGFGTPVDSNECIQWLNFAAELGSQKAQEALPAISRALRLNTSELTDPWTKLDDSFSVLSCSANGTESNESEARDREYPSRRSSYKKPLSPSKSFFLAAENCQYDVLDDLISSGAKPKTSADGVSPLHFLSSWHTSKAEALGKKLVAAGADINAHAKKGPTVGGTPLMWSVQGDHIEHSLILMKLGADPMAANEQGEDALSFAARLHLTTHLQILLENIKPMLFRGHLSRLVEAAAGGVSRFARMIRHGSAWTESANKTFELLQKWNSLLTETEDFETVSLRALKNAVKSPYGRMNTDVQMSLVKIAQLNPKRLGPLLRDSVLNYNADLFNALLEYNVPADGLYGQGKNLLHLCARIPDHNLASTAFAPPLLARKLPLDHLDDQRRSPWMDAILERKWDLADLLMNNGANPFLVDSSGFNVLGLCIQTLNLGAVKYLLKYCAAKAKFQHESFIVNPEKQISTMQLASTLTLPRAHGMKIEVIGLFLVVQGYYTSEPWQLDFRSDGILPHASALDIASSLGNVLAVKNLVKKGAHKVSGESALKIIHDKLKDAETMEYMDRKNLERCAYIIEHWDGDQEQTRKLADDWTNMRTIDESHVNLSWEIVIFDYKSRKGIVEVS